MNPNKTDNNRWLRMKMTWKMERMNSLLEKQNRNTLAAYQTWQMWMYHPCIRRCRQWCHRTWWHHNYCSRKYSSIFFWILFCLFVWLLWHGNRIPAGNFFFFFVSRFFFCVVLWLVWCDVLACYNCPRWRGFLPNLLFFFFFFLLRFTYYSAVMGARGFLNDDFMVIILERGMRIWISAWLVLGYVLWIFIFMHRTEYRFHMIIFDTNTAWRFSLFCSILFFLRVKMIDGSGYVVYIRLSTSLTYTIYT